ncbi:3845_t:CDS:2 [Funneliformis caledonium]|uniref:3845_t:CDS:1 n=1 Tax=Funneliformis caledonium TaxID=1117310 RepID=A0A9N9CGF2_9GLOM|nr:3845_t:CDS:2 [Funneliformis caledonium]
MEDETEAGPSRPTRRTALRDESARNVQKRRRRDEEEETEASSNEGSVSQPSTIAEKAAQKLTAEELERKVKDVVRLALFSELRKQPLKREDVTKKVLHEHSKTFQVVFEKAQELLVDIFGMSLAELPLKEKKAGGSRKPTSSTKYVLKNILSQDYRKVGIISWEKNNEEESMGLLTVILSLIHVNGKLLSDEQLAHYFRRLCLIDNDKFDLEKVLSTFVKQGYLNKQKVSRSDQSQNPEKESLEYSWGPRAKVEMPEENLIEFIRALFGQSAPPDLDKQIERSSGI